MSWLHDRTRTFLDEVQQAKDLQAFPFFRPFQNIGPRVKIGRGSYINFTSNDYLGLSQHPELIRAAIKGVTAFGTGLGSSRLQATSVRHDALEQGLAKWLGYPSCAVFTTGYQALVGVLSTYLDNETTVILDNYSHASILDGTFLAKGNNPELEVRFFKHNSAKGLERVLSACKRSKKLVVVEGLYSVDGDFAPLDKFLEICRKYDAPLMVDDAHGLGTLGMTGRGVGEIYNVLPEIDILVGTFSKSFGGVGGFVLADRDIIDYMKLQAKSFVYSASLPVPQVEAALAALRIIESDYSYFRRLHDAARYFRQGLLDLGFDLGESDESHITPIMVGDERKALTFGAYLYHGAKVIMLPFIYPGVPKGKARLRCNVTASHSKADLGYTLEALSVIGQQLDIIPKGNKTKSKTWQKALWLAEGKMRGAKNAGIPFVLDELSETSTKVYDWTQRWFNGHDENASMSK